MDCSTNSIDVARRWIQSSRAYTSTLSIAWTWKGTLQCARLVKGLKVRHSMKDVKNDEPIKNNLRTLQFLCRPNESMCFICRTHQVFFCW